MKSHEKVSNIEEAWNCNLCETLQELQNGAQGTSHWLSRCQNVFSSSIKIWHNHSFVPMQFEFLSFVTIKNFVTIRVFEFCNISSYEFCHNLSLVTILVL